MRTEPVTELLPKTHSRDPCLLLLGGRGVRLVFHSESTQHVLIRCS